jgi:hypothetical protein
MNLALRWGVVVTGHAPHGLATVRGVIETWFAAEQHRIARYERIFSPQPVST